MTLVAWVGQAKITMFLFFVYHLGLLLEPFINGRFIWGVMSYKPTKDFKMNFLEYPKILGVIICNLGVAVQP